MKPPKSDKDFWDEHERTERIKRAKFFIDTLLKLARFDSQPKVITMENFTWVRFVDSLKGLPRDERQKKMLDYIAQNGNKVGVRHVEIVEIQNKGTEFFKKGKTP